MRSAAYFSFPIGYESRKAALIAPNATPVTTSYATSDGFNLFIKPQNAPA